MISLAYITNIPTPYRKEMIEAWVRLNPGIKVTVYYTDDGDQGRGWNTEAAGGAQELRLKTLVHLGRFGKLNWGILRAVLRSDLVMVGGVEQATYLVAALFARLAGRGPILLFDGFSPRRVGHESRLVLLVKRITVWLSQAYFANGTIGRNYLLAILGASPRKPLFNQYLSHADRFFPELLEQFQDVPLQERRLRAGLAPDRPVVMCCGYLIYRKRVDLVIDALALLPENTRPQLLVVGDGPLKQELMDKALRAGVASRFVGHKNGRDLNVYYFAADLLVLASDDDPWGLVVNEAMRAGLPVVVSDACGVVLDLVKEGQNGFRFAAGASEELRDAVAKVLEADRCRMREASRALVASWSSEASATNLGRCIATLANASSR